jgi:DNA invertase Pin-like site-specific DNA recombinase
LRGALLEAADTRLEEDPETAAARDRLLAAGHSLEEIRILVACLISIEVHTVFRTQVNVPRARYLEWLEMLPEMPPEFSEGEE